MKKSYHGSPAIRLLAAILIAGLHASVSVAGTLRHTLEMDWDGLTVGYSFEEGERYTRLSHPGLLFSSHEGAPELPVCYFSFLVPPEATDFRVTAVPTETESPRHLRSRIYPVQRPCPTRSDYVSEFMAPDDAAYALHDGGTKAWVDDEQWIENHWRIVRVGVIPMAYDHKGLTITPATRISVSLDYSLARKGSSDNWRSTTPGNCQLQEMPWDIGAFVVNPGDFPESYRMPVAKLPATLEENAYSNNYVIVVPEALAGAAQRLADWKAQKGYKTTLATVESILSDSNYRPDGTNGREDKASSLRNYLKDKFNQIGRFFCLLIGDYRTSMPIRYKAEHAQSYTIKHKSMLQSSDYSPTDSYFERLSEEWNLKHDSRLDAYVIGEYEPWKSPDITAGRLLCSRPEQIHAYTEKLILYETDPGKGDPAYLNNAFFFEQRFAENRMVDEDGVEKEKRVDTEKSMRGEAQIVLDSVGVFPKHVVVLTDNSPEGVRPFTPTSLQVLEGMESSGFISWHGHGEPHRIGIRGGYHGYEVEQAFIHADSQYCTRSKEDFSQSSSLMPEDAYNGLDLLENPTRPGIVYSISCTNVPFDCYVTQDSLGNLTKTYDYEQNLGSAYTTSRMKGGVAFLGYTRAGWVKYSAEMERYFVKALQLHPQIGVAEWMSKINYPTGNTLKFRHHLIGDPELSMWLGVPSTLKVEIQPTTTGIAVSGPELRGATLSIWNGDNNSSSRNVLHADEVLINRPSDNDTNFSIYGIWKRNALPLLHMQLYPGSSQGHETPIHVNTCDFSSYLDHEHPFIMSPEASLDLSVKNEICISDGLKLNKGNNIALDSQKSITMASLEVPQGCTLNLRSKETILGAGFSIERGAEVTIDKY